ncbi:hypothetical protein [Streptomyces sp. RKAG337]|uniref:hypothetical protein n=1 Tax=Streptomyces sp. RKAG337 TaxID=2893404 RepID=UPI002033D0DE|nr:hypothetical protein [Streptomyces sp. RKAG337]MCM2430915.1 hypothetical protein [Streptomyces sp. RKAG337]
MLVPDLSRLLREADHSRLTAAVEAAVDAVAWYAAAPKPDYGDTELSTVLSNARAEVAQEVVDAVVLALSASVKTVPACDKPT